VQKLLCAPASLERQIKLVNGGTAVIIPVSDRTRGHGTHTPAAVWKEDLAELPAEHLAGKRIRITG
jgi:hypothetical protein